MIPTAFIFHEDYEKHDTGNQIYSFGDNQNLNVGLEFENPLRVRYIKEMLEKTGLLQNMIEYSPIAATDADLLRVHPQHHIDHMRDLCLKGERVLGQDVLGCPVSETIARLAAGGAILGVELALQGGPVKQAYSLIRPPGHHASTDQAMGFCLYNNVAIAARYAQEKFGLERVAIVDWDVHHGNGTQEIFYHDPNVLFISLHEEGYFPLHSGLMEEIGEGKGTGYNINIPLPPATGEDGYRFAFEELVLPILEQFHPQLILVSAGQDPNGLDPLSRMMLMRPGFRYMAKSIREVAEKVCDGRLVLLQEGGYSLPYLPIATLGVIEGLMDCEAAFQDPHAIPHRPITAELRDTIAKCKQTFSPYWNLSTKHLSF